MKEKDFWGGTRNADCLFLFESGDMSGPPLGIGGANCGSVIKP